MIINPSKSNNLLILIILVLEVILAIFVFLYPVLKPIPVGTDAATYLNDAKWITNNEVLPAPKQATYHGYLAYPSPFTSLIIVLLNKFTGLNLVYPLFSIYQLFLIFLIILSSYSVGKIYNNLMSLLLPIALLGSFAIIRLFIGSTVSNLLAFVYINIIYYLVYQYLITKKNRILILIILCLIDIFFTHNYLTAPLFIPLFILYTVFIFLVDKQLKHYLFINIKRINRYIKTFVLLIFTGLLLSFIFFYKSVFYEAISAFWKTSVEDKFRGAIPASQYGIYLGSFVFLIAIAGLIFYIIRFKKNILSYKILPFLWIIFLLGMLQTYRLGFDFYYERIIFLAAIFIPFFAAYLINFAFEKTPTSRRYFILILALFFVLTITSGLNKVWALYDSSNAVSKNQIMALNLLKDVSQNNDLVYSNVNAVSQTAHDIMISGRNIIYLSTEIVFCKENTACLAFNEPNDKLSIDYFKKNNVKYFLFMMPSYEGNERLNILIKKYESSNYYNDLVNLSDVMLFKLAN